MLSIEQQRSQFFIKVAQNGFVKKRVKKNFCAVRGNGGRLGFFSINVVQQVDPPIIFAPFGG